MAERKHNEESLSAAPARQAALRERTSAAAPHPAALLRDAARGPLAPARVLQLQRAAGNRATARLLGGKGTRPIQAKLVVAPAGDPFELEADRVAELVVGAGPDAGAETFGETAAKPASHARALARLPAEEEEDETAVRLKAASGSRAFEVGAGVEAAIEASRGRGQSLSEGVRASMETALGVDLGGVRLHTDAEAHALNRSLGARAFTTGHDVYFARGQYDQHSPEGRKLLAHELTHVAQQSGGAVRRSGGAVPAGGLLAEPASVRRVRRQPATKWKSNPLPNLKKEFRNGGEKHTLYQEVFGGELKLMMATHPQLIQSLLERLKKNYAPDDVNIVELEQLVKVYTKSTSGWKEDLGAALRDTLKRIVVLLPQLGAGALAPPRTEVTWGARRYSTAYGSSGTSMEANPLSIDPGDLAGSEPSGGWGHLVKGHLLNHHLHGPAERKNLAPITRTLNGAHEDQVESKIKEYVLKRNGVVRYKVTADYTGKGFNEPPVGLVFEVEALKLTPNTDSTDKSNWAADPDQSAFADVPAKLDQQGKVYAKRDDAAGALDVGELEEEEYEQDGELHHVYFEERDGSAELVIASSPKLLSTYLAAIKPTDDKKDIKEELDLLVKRYNNLSQFWTYEFGLELSEILSRVVEILEYINLGEKPLFPESSDVVSSQIPHMPPSEIKYGPTKSFPWMDGPTPTIEVGTWMEAGPLSINPGEHVGYEPQDTEKWSPYVMGHLLNHHVHGPAEPQNLVPMSPSCNQQFEREAESKVKKEVLEHNKVVYFKVQATRWEGDDDMPGDESQVPRLIKVELYEMELKEGGKPEKPSHWRRKLIDLYNKSIPNVLGSKKTRSEHEDFRL